VSLRLCRRCGAVGPSDTPCCDRPAPLAHPEIASLTLAHIDCDAFFAAIEKRDDPSLAAQPVIVGGGQRGVVATACYVARAFGVRSAMPMFKALKLCPHAVVKKPDIARYSAEGRRIREMMQTLTPAVQPVSIDEAYLDLSGCEALHGGPAAGVLARLQNRIEAECGLSVSVGLSHNKLMAKMASELDKPRGFAVIGRAETLDFLAGRPVSALPGVGPAGAKALAKVGFETIGDIRTADLKGITVSFGEWGLRLHAMAHGRDDRPVDPEAERKTISAETTFNEDIADPGQLEDRLWLLCEKVATRTRAADSAGRTITLKLKDVRFQTRTRRRTLSAPTRLAHRLFQEARTLLAHEADGVRAFRLIGVGLSDLCGGAGADQGDLMDTSTPKRAAAEDAIAKVRDKFGIDAVATARAMKLRRRAKPNQDG
jgi:DNA polymerase IV